MNQVWLYLVLIAHDLITWTKTLPLTGELATPPPRPVLPLNWGALSLQAGIPEQQTNSTNHHCRRHVPKSL